MTAENVNPLLTETVIPLTEAAADFGGGAIPLATVRKYVYRGVQGLKLESVSINGRYASKEAIQRFIERKQNLDSQQIEYLFQRNNYWMPVCGNFDFAKSVYRKVIGAD